MNAVKKLFLPFLLLLLIFSGCKKNEYYDNYLKDYSEIYAAIKKNRYVEYKVDSFEYRYNYPTQFIDTHSYYIKELIADTFRDNAGRLNARIEIYKKYNLTDAYQIDRVWYAYRSKTSYERIEDDIRYVKLIFPPAVGRTWNGNQYVPFSDVDGQRYDYLKDWSYQYTSFDVPMDVTTLHFDFTATVEEVNDENLIDKKLSVVTYAKDVGIIKKEFWLINKQDPASPWSAPNKANGVKILYNAIAFRP